MSQLESAAKPPLQAWISGNDISQFSPSEKFILARWAVKTMACLNAASNYHHNVPAAHFHHLFGDRLTLPRNTVVVGKNVACEEPFWWIQGGQWLATTPKGRTEELKGLTRSAYKIALQFGNAAIGVAYWPDPSWAYELTDDGSIVLGHAVSDLSAPAYPDSEIEVDCAHDELLKLLIGVRVRHPESEEKGG